MPTKIHFLYTIQTEKLSHYLRQWGYVLLSATFRKKLMEWICRKILLLGSDSGWLMDA